MKAKTALLGLLFVLVGGAGGYFWWDQLTIRELDRAKELYRKSGLPLVVAEIAPPSVTDEFSAHPQVEKLNLLIKPHRFGTPEHDNNLSERLFQFKLAHANFALSHAERAVLAAMFNEPAGTKALELAHEIASKTRFDTRVRYDRGLKEATPAVGGFIDVLSILSAHARLAINQGRADDASRDIAAMFRFAMLMGPEPTLISQLTCAAGIGMALSTLEKVVAVGPVSERNLRELGDRIKAIDLLPDVLRSLDGERLTGASPLFEGMISGEKSAAQALGFEFFQAPWWTSVRYNFTAPVRSDYILYLTKIHEMRSAVASSFTAPLTLTQRLDRIKASIPESAALSEITVPTIGGLIMKLWRAKAQLEIARVGIGLELHRLKHGALPETLSALSPEFLPANWIKTPSAAILTYRITDHGAIVYNSELPFAEDREDEPGMAPGDVAWKCGALALEARKQ